MAAVQMQARSSVDGLLKTWVAVSPDWAAVGFPGPGSALDVAVSMRASEGTGGGASDHGLLTGLSDDDHTHYELARRPLSAYTGAASTAVLADARKHITTSHGSANTFTIPPQASVVWLAESLLGGTNIGAGAMTLAPGAGVTLTGSVVVPQNSWWWAKRTGTNAWQVFVDAAPDAASITLNASGQHQRAALTGDVTASAGANATTIANDAVTFAKLLNATAADKVIGSDAAGDFKELTLTGGIERSGTNLQLSSQLPARGGENVILDLYPSTQQQGTLATATTVNFDVAVPTGKRYTITADVWMDDGAGGACLYTKALQIKAHQTGGAAVKVSDVTLAAPLEGAGFTFTAAVSTTNIRFALSNTSGSTRSYNIAIGFWSMDKP